MSNKTAPKFELAGKSSILQKIVFELRYRYGYTYLDKCGRVINLIQREIPEWVPQADQVNPQNAPLVSLTNACLFNFSSHSLSFSLEKPLGKEPHQTRSTFIIATKLTHCRRWSSTSLA